MFPYQLTRVLLGDSQRGVLSAWCWTCRQWSVGSDTAPLNVNDNLGLKL